MAKTIFFIAAFAACLAIAAGGCYSCDSYSDPNCDDKSLDLTSIKSYRCSGDKCGKIKYEYGGEDIKVRFCATSQCSKDGEEKEYNYAGYKGTLYCCVGDKCNGAESVKGLTVFAGVCTITAILKNYF